MGNYFSFIKEIFSFKNYKVLMIGLDAVGKTTILYRLKLEEIVTTIPTMGFNVETVKLYGINFTIWDASSQEKIRPLWRYYLEGTNILIFVIDSSDHERIEEAKNELYRMLSYEELKKIPILIYANKQDLINKMSVEEIEERLNLNSIPNIRWFIQGCSAIEGTGLYEGLEWVKNNTN